MFNSLASSTLTFPIGTHPHDSHQAGLRRYATTPNTMGPYRLPCQVPDTCDRKPTIFDDSATIVINPTGNSVRQFLHEAGDTSSTLPFRALKSCRHELPDRQPRFGQIYAHDPSVFPKGRPEPPSGQDDPDKITLIRTLPQPTQVWELSSSLPQIAPLKVYLDLGMLTRPT